MSTMTEVEQQGSRTGSPLEVLRIFAKLGFTCFGGPIAHIGYFRDEFVVRRKWVETATGTDLLRVMISKSLNFTFLHCEPLVLMKPAVESSPKPQRTAAGTF